MVIIHNYESRSFPAAEATHRSIFGWELDNKTNIVNTESGMVTMRRNFIYSVSDVITKQEKKYFELYKSQNKTGKKRRRKGGKKARTSKSFGRMGESLFLNVFLFVAILFIILTVVLPIFIEIEFLPWVMGALALVFLVLALIDANRKKKVDDAEKQMAKIARAAQKEVIFVRDQSLTVMNLGVRYITAAKEEKGKGSSLANALPQSISSLLAPSYPFPYSTPYPTYQNK